MCDSASKQGEICMTAFFVFTKPCLEEYTDITSFIIFYFLYRIYENYLLTGGIEERLLSMADSVDLSKTKK